MPLTSKQRSHIRALAHHLEPTVRVGRAGVNDAVVKEADQTIEAHEVIKVRIESEADDRDQIARDLAAALGAELAGVIGKIAILYRPSAESPRVKLP